MRGAVSVKIYGVDSHSGYGDRLLIRMIENVHLIVVFISPDPYHPVDMLCRKTAKARLIIVEVMACQSSIHNS